MTRRIICVLGCVALIGLVGLSLAGCSSEDTSATTRPVDSAAPLAQKGGAQLWSENCGRCHNLRSPSSLSPAQWQVVVHHMRLRAGLTGDESQAITDFLKSAH